VLLDLALDEERAAVGIERARELAAESHRTARAALNEQRVDELVQLGTQKASRVAEETMTRVRDAVKLT